MNRLRTLVMALWAVGLLGLLLAKRYPLFIRAELWPLLLGTALMFGMFLIALTARRGSPRSPINAAAWLQASMLILPLTFMGSLMSNAAASGLNSFALQKRSLGLSSGLDSLNGGLDASSTTADTTKEISLGYVIRHRKALDGKQITVVGKLFKDDSLPSGQVTLYRFVVVCCAADAIPVQLVVRNAHADKFKDDDWIRVTGTLTSRIADAGVSPSGRQLIIDATDIQPTEAPSEPYLSQFSF